MTTELDIIATIWDIVRGGEYNQDDSINERLLRSFLRIHRGKLLYRIYKNGEYIPDEAFQELGNIEFTLSENVLTSPSLPKIIRFKNNYGIIASVDEYAISVVNSEEWNLLKKDKFNKYHPLIKFINNKLFLYTGEEIFCEREDTSTSLLNRTVRKLKEQLNTASSGTPVLINIKAVLVDPEDGLNYDFTTTPYPFPDELIEDLINSVNAREFNLFLRTRSDEVGDNRNNNAEFNTREETT